MTLTQGHKRLRRVLRSIPDAAHVVPSAMFQFDTAALPGEANNDRYLKKIFGSTSDVISDVYLKFCIIFGKFKPGAIKFRTENLSSSLADSRGRPPPPSAPSACKIREYPIGARVKKELRPALRTPLVISELEV